jgi:hypothetical protein
MKQFSHAQCVAWEIEYNVAANVIDGRFVSAGPFGISIYTVQGSAY